MSSIEYSDTVRGLPVVAPDALIRWPRYGNVVRPMDQVGRNGHVVEVRHDVTSDTFYHRIAGDNMIGGTFVDVRYVNGKPGSAWFSEDELETCLGDLSGHHH